MKILSLRLENFKGFKELDLFNLSKSINVFIGHNNSGKSTILKSIYRVQSSGNDQSEVTLGASTYKIQLEFEGSIPNYYQSQTEKSTLVVDFNNNNRIVTDLIGNQWGVPLVSNLEPDNVIYPYFSNRKVANLSDTVNSEIVKAVSGNFHNLYSKIDRILVPEFDGNDFFTKACMDILGFKISSLQLGAGKRPAYLVKGMQNIEVSSMGDGVINILGVIADLAIAEDKIFLIEEIENDLHPKALKKLLQLIIDKSENNQFFVSTHSNIVMKYLASEIDSKLFFVESSKGEISEYPLLYTSKCREITSNLEDRLFCLTELGYEPLDFSLWEGWLFLEESSAEIIIREYLIPWFTPKLINRLKTVSTKGNSEVLPRFKEFNRLFLFLHLQPIYKDRVWVILDYCSEAERIISNLRINYKSWNPDNFQVLSNKDVEYFYPQNFKELGIKALSEKDPDIKRLMKKQVLIQLLEWMNSETEIAKVECEKSFQEIILKLKSIEKVVLSKAI